MEDPQILELHRVGHGPPAPQLPWALLPPTLLSAHRTDAEAGGLCLGGRAGLCWPRRLSAALQVFPICPAALHGGPHTDPDVGSRGPLSCCKDGQVGLALLVSRVPGLGRGLAKKLAWPRALCWAHVALWAPPQAGPGACCVSQDLEHTSVKRSWPRFLLDFVSTLYSSNKCGRCIKARSAGFSRLLFPGSAVPSDLRSAVDLPLGLLLPAPTLQGRPGGLPTCELRGGGGGRGAAAPGAEALPLRPAVRLQCPARPRGGAAAQPGALVHAPAPLASAAARAGAGSAGACRARAWAGVAVEVAFGDGGLRPGSAAALCGHHEARRAHPAAGRGCAPGPGPGGGRSRVGVLGQRLVVAGAGRRHFGRCADRAACLFRPRAQPR